MSLVNLKSFNDYIMDEFLQEGYVCLDGTCGNGHDTLTMRKLVGDSGKIYSFDIQEDAINSAKELLSSKKLDCKNIEFLVDSHEKIDLYVKESIDFAIFNLGYLPGGDKALTTIWDSTRKSLEKTLEIMRKGALLSVTAYPGHEEGYLERNQLKEYLLSLNSKKYNITNLNYFNQKDTAPETFIIEKRK